MDRIAMLQGFISANPRDPFPRYGLALEYKNQGRLDEAALAFDDLMTSFPDYTPAYFHAGTVQAERGDKSRAAEIFRLGVDVCTRRGDAHAKGEILAALASLDGDGEGGEG